MASNFGIGLGSFLSGVTQGAQAYQGIKNMQSQAKLNDIKVKKAEQDYAEDQRNSDIQAEVEKIGQVGLSEAQTKYGEDNKKVLDYYYTNTIPKQQQHLIAAGKVEAADMLGKFMETKQAKQLTEASANAIRMASNGDYQGLGPAIENILNVSNGVFGTGDSYKFKAVTELKDGKGIATGGAKIDFIDSSGKEQSISFNNQNELISFIRNNAMPDKVVEYAYDQQKQAQAVRAKQLEDERDWNQEKTKLAIQQGYGIQRDNNQSANRQTEQKSAALIKSQLGQDSNGNSTENKKVADAQAMISFLKSQGASDEYIQANMASIVGITSQQRPMSSRIDDYVKMMSSNDLSFAKLSNTEKVKQAKEYIASVDGVSTQSTTANPFQGNAQGKGLTPYVDTKTGTVVYR